MKEHTKCYVSLVTLFVALVIFVQTNVLTIMIFELKESNNKVQTIQTQEKENDLSQEKDWIIKIPKLDLSASIKEGTEEKIINDYVGHFKNTPNWDGNVGLIAGCYGYKENYFSNLDKLAKGDVILYKYGDQKKEYKVVENVIIEQKDWSYLSATKENKLTLITGVINESEKRRCVQAIEVK